MGNRFYKTATLVTGLSLAERSLGFLYRMVLARMVGAEGLGTYQIALSVYAVFMTLCGGGIPVTVSRLISKNRAERNSDGEKKSLAAGFTFAFTLCIPVLLVFFLSGELFAFLFTDENGLDVFKILLVGLLFCALYGVLKSWFWGQKNFLSSSVFGIIEESVAVIVGVLLLRGANGSLNAAKSAAWANTLSHVVAFACALAWFFFKKGGFQSPKGYLKPLIASATPITAVRVGSSLVNSAVSVLLPVMLIRAGYSESDALKTFGVISGMVMPALFITVTVIGAFSLVLSPELSEDYYAKRHERLKRNIDRGLTAATLVACVLMPFFFILGEDVGLLAYSSQSAGLMIAQSCPILLPMSLSMISTTILNAIGFEKQTFRFYFLGAAVMLLCVCFLPAFCGGYAYLIGMGASFTVCAVCNLVFLFKKVLPVDRKFGFFKKSLLSVGLVAPITFVGQTFSVLFRSFFGELLASVCLAFLLALVTLVFYFALKVVTKDSAKRVLK